MIASFACNSCQRATGAPCVAWFVVNGDDFAIVHGVPLLSPSWADVVRAFCDRCGTSLTYQRADAPEIVGPELRRWIIRTHLRRREIFTEEKSRGIVE